MKVKTTRSAQSPLVECLESLIGHISVLQLFISFLNFEKFSSDLILFGICSQSFGASYDKDSVPYYTVLIDLVERVSLLLTSQLEHVLRG